MKLSFRYGDHTSQYKHDGGLEFSDHRILAGKRVPGKDEFLIDLNAKNPAEIQKYRKFARKNWDMYSVIYAEEMRAQVLAHADGDPRAKRKAAKLHRMNLKLIGEDDPVSFEKYFARLSEEFVAPKDDGTGNLKLVSLAFGEYKPLYAFDHKTGMVRRRVMDGRRREKGEFVIDVYETDRAKIAKYGRFVAENLDMYLHMFAEEMRFCTRAYKDGILEARDSAQKLFEMNQRFDKAAVPVDFETYFERADSFIERMGDFGDQSLIKASFGFVEARSQYVAEKGAGVHKKHHIVAGEPPEPGEIVIEMDETRPEVLEQYMEFVAENLDLYMDMFQTEMIVLVFAHVNGAKDAKRLAKQLFSMNARLTGAPESEFEEFFAKQVEIARKKR